MRQNFRRFKTKVENIDTSMLKINVNSKVEVAQPRQMHKIAATPSEYHESSTEPTLLYQLTNKSYVPQESHYMSPQQILAQYSDQLTTFEQSEILRYKKIYYWGQKLSKQNLESSTIPDSYQPRDHDHIAYRYEVLERLNSGSFGVVFAAYDYENRETVAIKMINPGPKLFRQALVEYQISAQIKSNFSVQSKCAFQFRNRMLIVQELLSLNLYEVIESNQFQKLPIPFIKTFVLHSLAGLSEVHSNGAIHCDLKPENFAFDLDFKRVKLIDFGTACYKDNEMYSYIQSRFYRAPEVLLEMPFGQPMDLWGLGCIICELYSGKPLFEGNNTEEMINLIQALIGPVPPAMLVQSKVKNEIFIQNDVKAKGLQSIIDQNSIFDLQLLQVTQQLLQWDPNERTSAKVLLKQVQNQFEWKEATEYKIEMRDLQQERKFKKIVDGEIVQIDMGSGRIEVK
ncbi:Kinase [Hexamita inflata]|uniref:dual-specificity kinase n=1 Tax=Hexamita inflata TaxID=28002 RepID=A0AA86PZ47_9EUKA|nr:CMGC DYRK [Hexamita inflata]